MRPIVACLRPADSSLEPCSNRSASRSVLFDVSESVPTRTFPWTCRATNSSCVAVS